MVLIFAFHIKHKHIIFPTKISFSFSHAVACLLITFAVYQNTWYVNRYKPSETSLSYSYALTVTTFVFESIASILMLVEMRNQSLEIAMMKQESLEQLRNSSHLDRQNEEEIELDDGIVISSGRTESSPYELFQQFTTADNHQEQRNHKFQNDDPNKRENGYNIIDNSGLASARSAGARPRTYGDGQYGRNQGNHDDNESIYHEINGGETCNLNRRNEGSSVQVSVDVHSTGQIKQSRPQQPDSQHLPQPRRPSRKRRSKALGQQVNETSLHSYENIPDGSSNVGHQHRNASQYANERGKLNIHEAPTKGNQSGGMPKAGSQDQRHLNSRQGKDFNSTANKRTSTHTSGNRTNPGGQYSDRKQELVLAAGQSQYANKMGQVPKQPPDGREYQSRDYANQTGSVHNKHPGNVTSKYGKNQYQYPGNGPSKYGNDQDQYPGNLSSKYGNNQYQYPGNVSSKYGQSQPSTNPHKGTSYVGSYDPYKNSQNSQMKY